MIDTDTWKDIKTRHYAEVRDKLISRKRDQGAIEEVLQAFSEGVRSDTENQTLAIDEILIKSGAPAEMIIQTAEEQNCDLIVMGTHGCGAIAEVLIGSTAKWVVRRSSIPVLASM